MEELTAQSGMYILEHKAHSGAIANVFIHRCDISMCVLVFLYLKENVFLLNTWLHIQSFHQLRKKKNEKIINFFNSHTTVHQSDNHQKLFVVSLLFKVRVKDNCVIGHILLLDVRMCEEKAKWKLQKHCLAIVTFF